MHSGRPEATTGGSGVMTAETTKYANVIFLQGEEAEPALALYEFGGWEALASYLAAYEDGNDLELHNEPLAGEDDQQMILRDYILTMVTPREHTEVDHPMFGLLAYGEVEARDYLINVNTKLRYCGMERIVFRP